MVAIFSRKYLSDLFILATSAMRPHGIPRDFQSHYIESFRMCLVVLGGLCGAKD